jgi:hypothetical protein
MHEHPCFNWYYLKRNPSVLFGRQLTHIKTLLDAMAPCGENAKDVLLSVVDGLRANSLDLPSRNIDEQVINELKRWKPDGTQLATGAALPSDSAWDVNWAKAPFRLTAIVNRIDLKENPTIGNAGEGRFVFCLVDPKNPNDGNPIPFTVILEYLQPASTPQEITAIANAWHQLGTFSSFDANYVEALKKVTAKFAAKGAMPGRPNHCALAQLRTNEIALNPISVGAGWELREFVLNNKTGRLTPATVKLTPHNRLNNSEVLSFLVNRFGLGLSDRLPDEILGFRAITGFDPNFQWAAPGIDVPNPALRKFSINTCNGCHGGDARTNDVEGFYQIGIRQKSTKATLSRFLTGQPTTSTLVIDPSTGIGTPGFSDLENRRLFLSAIVGAPLVSPTVGLAPMTAGAHADSLHRILEIREAFKDRIH